MTASCPNCGGKWDIEGEHYDILLRCGDEHDIKCYYCKEVIPFVIERKYLEETIYTNIIVRLEKKLEKKELELRIRIG